QSGPERRHGFDHGAPSRVPGESRMKRTLFGPVALLLAFGLGPALASARLVVDGCDSMGVDTDNDGMSDDCESTLAHKYSLVYWFHPDELYYFFDPSTYINSTGLQLNAIFAPWNSGHSAFDPYQWRVAILSNGGGILAEWAPADPATFADFISGINSASVHDLYPEIAAWIDSYGWDNLIIEVPKDPDEGYVHWHLDPQTPIHYLASPNTEGNIELQFWQFSHRDAKGSASGYGDHWCDWTRAILVFEVRDNTVVEPPLYAYY